MEERESTYRGQHSALGYVHCLLHVQYMHWFVVSGDEDDGKSSSREPALPCGAEASGPVPNPTHIPISMSSSQHHVMRSLLTM